MCYLSFNYLRYSSSLDYIYSVNFGPIRDWQPNNLSIKKRGGKVCLASISSAKQLGLKVFVNNSPGATWLQNLFFPEEPQRQSSTEEKKSLRALTL